MVDYSKWNKMAAEMSEESDDDEGGKPVVTKFEEPTAVTWGGTQQQQQQHLQQQVPAKTGAAATPTQAIPASPTAKPLRLAALTKNGSAVTDGSGKYLYFWSQTRGEVVLTVVAPPGTKAGEVKVEVTPDPFMPTSAKSPLGHHIKLCAGSAVLLEGDLLHPVTLDPEEPGTADWVLEDLGLPEEPSSEPSSEPSTENSLTAASPLRAITVSLAKHSPIPGATLWWRGVLKAGPEIDVGSIEGRDVKAAEAGQQVWADAMESFKARVAEMKANRTEVDTS